MEQANKDDLKMQLDILDKVKKKLYNNINDYSKSDLK